MSERVKWLDHKGKKTLYNDYTNLAGDEMLKPIKELGDHLDNLDEKEILPLLDFRNSYANKANVEALRKSGERNKQLFKKVAVLGITGVKKVFLHMVNKLTGIGANPFDTEEEAKDWLIS